MLYAKWTPITYNITWDLDGGYISDDVILPNVYTIDSFLDNIYDFNNRGKGMLFYAEGEESVKAEEILSNASIIVEESDLLDCWQIDDSISSVCFIQDIDTDTENFTEEVIVFEYGDAATANEVFNNLIDSYASVGVDVDALETQEYGDDGETAYMVINIGTEEYVNMMAGEDMSQEEIDQYMDQIAELLGEIHIVAAFYQKDNRVYQTLYISMGAPVTAKTIQFITDDGFADPFTVKNSDALMDAMSSVMA